MSRLLFFVCLGSAAALKLHLCVSARPAAVNVDVPGGDVVATKLAPAKHRLRMCQLVSEQIRSSAPPVSQMRVHMHRRSLHDWETAVEVQTNTKITEKRLVHTTSAHRALDAVLETAQRVYHLDANAQAAGLVPYC